MLPIAASVHAGSETVRRRSQGSPGRGGCRIRWGGRLSD